MSEPTREDGDQALDAILDQLHSEAFGPDGEVIDDLKHQAIVAVLLVSRAVGRYVESLPPERRQQVTPAEAWASLHPMLREAVPNLARQGVKIPVVG